MSMIFVSGYEDKAYLFSDMRVSVTLNGETYYSHDGVEKAKVFNGMIIFGMGQLDAVNDVFDSLTALENRAFGLKEIQSAAREAYKLLACKELGIYVLTIDQNGRYVINSMVYDSDFEIESESDYIKNRDIIGAGANSDEALDYIGKRIGRTGSKMPYEIIRDSYSHVADEKVGGACVIFEVEAVDRYRVRINRYESPIADTKPLKQLMKHATLDGSARFKKVKITDGNDTALIDSTTRKFYLNNWNIEGIGSLDAQFIQAGTATIDDGFINNLTVTALKTLDKSDAIGDSVDYVHAKDNYIKFITGTIIDRNHAQNTDGDNLYWTDSSKTQLTTDLTAFPFYELQYSPVEKLSFFLEGEGMASYPRSIWGTGDGITELSGKAIIEKPVGSLDITYHRSNTGAIRAIKLENVGITIRAENDGAVTIEGDNINLIANDKIRFNASEYIFE